MEIRWPPADLRRINRGWEEGVVADDPPLVVAKAVLVGKGLEEKAQGDDPRPHEEKEEHHAPLPESDVGEAEAAQKEHPQADDHHHHQTDHPLPGVQEDPHPIGG